MADFHFFSFSRFARLGLLLALWGHSEALQAQPTEKTPEKPPMEAMDAKVEAARVATEYARVAGLPAVSVGQSVHYTLGLPEKAQRFQAGVLAAMDRYHAAALKGVGGQAKKFWPKRPVVLVFPERTQFASYMRRVEKRSFDATELASMVVTDDQPAIAMLWDNNRATAPGHASLEVQVGERVAAAVFLRMVGAKNPVPSWLPVAFGTATSFQVAIPTQRGYLTEVRRNAQAFGKGQKECPWDASLAGSRGQAAQASFAYWLAFGPRAGKMAGLAKQFVPEENQEKVEMAQAMKKAMLEDSDLQALWQGWVATWR